jgi:16S rRNA (cytidine1402-2'-O)-methyltransferase
MPSGPGVLYVVATPIGNLEDFTFRALRTLKEVDLIAAEDTRRTAKLLAHYQIAKPVVSLREHNEVREAPRLVQKMLSGTRIALVSDAGTPAIADPGARLVRAALEHGITVTPIPGPSAITAALSVSGQLSTEFAFMGFPPATGSARRDWFERLAREPRTVVFFEAPHRIERSLTDAKAILANRPIIVHREISKINEISVESHNVKPVGEITVVVEPSPGPSPVNAGGRTSEIIGQIIESSLLAEEVMESVVASMLGSSQQAAKKVIKKHRIKVKQQKSSAT